MGLRVNAIYDQDGSRWTVMQDPEGNELCVQSPP